MNALHLQPPTPRFVTDRFEQALAYWESKRHGRRMPSRGDIDPLEIPSFLANVVLVDVKHDPLDFSYRLIGTAVVQRIERDYTGVRFMDIPHQRPGSRVWDAAVRLVHQKQPFYSDIPYVGPDAFVDDYQDLYMPLSDDDDAVNMIFGLIEFEMRS